MRNTAMPAAKILCSFRMDALSLKKELEPSTAVFNRAGVLTLGDASESPVQLVKIHILESYPQGS